MKKILLGLGTLATIAAPVAAVVACGTETENHSKNNKNLKNAGTNVSNKQNIAVPKIVEQRNPEKLEILVPELLEVKVPKILEHHVLANTNVNQNVVAPKNTATVTFKLLLPNPVESILPPKLLAGGFSKNMSEFESKIETFTATKKILNIKRVYIKSHKKIKTRFEFVTNQINFEFDQFISNLLKVTPDAFTQDSPLSSKHLIPSIQSLVNHARDSIKVTGEETQEELNELLNKNVDSFKEIFNDLLGEKKLIIEKEIKTNEEIYESKHIYPIEKDLQVTPSIDNIAAGTQETMTGYSIGVEHNKIPGPDMLIKNHDYETPKTVEVAKALHKSLAEEWTDILSKAGTTPKEVFDLGISSESIPLHKAAASISIGMAVNDLDTIISNFRVVVEKAREGFQVHKDMGYFEILEKAGITKEDLIYHFDSDLLTRVRLVSIGQPKIEDKNGIQSLVSALKKDFESLKTGK